MLVGTVTKHSLETALRGLVKHGVKTSFWTLESWPTWMYWHPIIRRSVLLVVERNASGCVLLRAASM
jgi:hypothetical protein